MSRIQSQRNAVQYGLYAEFPLHVHPRLALRMGGIPRNCCPVSAKIDGKIVNIAVRKIIFYLPRDSTKRIATAVQLDLSRKATGLECMLITETGEVCPWPLYRDLIQINPYKTG